MFHYTGILLLDFDLLLFLTIFNSKIKISLNLDSLHEFNKVFYPHFPQILYQSIKIIKNNI